MIIQPDESDAIYHINRFEPGTIWINQQQHTCSVIVRPQQLVSPWAPRNLAELIPHHFEILSPLPDVLLLGTGPQLIIPPQTLLIPLFEKRIGVEFMDSRAACFTYTALAAEGRNVAACILIS